MGERGFSRKAVYVKKRPPKIKIPKPIQDDRPRSLNQRTITKNIKK
jgi:hypothetical protein